MKSTLKKINKNNQKLVILKNKKIYLFMRNQFAKEPEKIIEIGRVLIL